MSGSHFSGPPGQAADGSTVVGAPLVVSDAPNSAAIPWLMLHATAHDGAGLFAEVAYIARAQTVGGSAPLTGCDAMHQGAETRTPSSASYTFFTPAVP